jgi:hypothetical protein
MMADLLLLLFCDATPTWVTTALDLEASTSEMNTNERKAIIDDVQWTSARRLRPM